MFKIDLNSRLSLKEMIYIMAILLVNFGSFVSGVSMSTVFALNGAVVGFLYVIMIPIWIHLKCIWYDKSSGTIEGDDDWNREVVPHICECKNHYKYKWTLYL